MTDTPIATPRVSIIILNYNGAPWLERCFASLRNQSFFSQLEIIVADNRSTDSSDTLAAELIRDWPSARFIQHGANLGYCEGNNRAAQTATGQYLFFLNNDTWLEPDCLEKLVQGVEHAGAAAGMPLVLNYPDDSFQSFGAGGFDLFGLTSKHPRSESTREVLMPEGCAYLVDRGVFNQLGGFDREFFMFSDELDLSWRVWIAGHRAVAIPEARLHHRGAANVNPEGGGQTIEFRTSDTKRFYANRNGLFVLIKNCQHFLLLLVPLQIGLLLAEALVGTLIVRRGLFLRRTCLDALTDCWRKRGHLASERRRIRQFRKRGDFWMLRFLRLRPNRLDELLRMIRFGTPKVSSD